MDKKFTITATIVLEIEAPSSEAAAQQAFWLIDNSESTPQRISVWNKEDPKNHWFADQYTWSNPPVLIKPNPQGAPTLSPVKVQANEASMGQVGARA